VDKANLADEICHIIENPYSSDEERIRASDEYSYMRATINKAAENYSTILTPSAVDEAPVGLDNMGSAAFNTMWTASVAPPHRSIL